MYRPRLTASRAAGAEFERLGGTDTIRLTCAWCATNKDLGKAIIEDNSGGSLLPPQCLQYFHAPLRERKSDVLLLADHTRLSWSHHNTRQSEPSMNA